MKTKIKTQKTSLKSLAVIAGSLIVCLNVSAQDLWQSFNKNVPSSEIALAIIDNNNESKTASSNTKGLTDLNSFETLIKKESDKTMVLEKWMTSEDLFKAGKNQIKKKIIKTETFVFEEISDSNLEFEDWMFNPGFWKVKK